MITGFCHKVDEICALLEYYTVYSGNSLPINIPEECRSQMTVCLNCTHLCIMLNNVMDFSKAIGHISMEKKLSISDCLQNSGLLFHFEMYLTTHEDFTA